MKLLAAHIRKLRGERGLSQERLAELAQMHRTYLGGIETARRNPSFKNLFRLARALGVSLCQMSASGPVYEKPVYLPQSR